VGIVNQPGAPMCDVRATGLAVQCLGVGGRVLAIRDRRSAPGGHRLISTVGQRRDSSLPFGEPLGGILTTRTHGLVHTSFVSTENGETSTRPAVTGQRWTRKSTIQSDRKPDTAIRCNLRANAGFWRELWLFRAISARRTTDECLCCLYASGPGKGRLTVRRPEWLGADHRRSWALDWGVGARWRQAGLGDIRPQTGASVDRPANGTRHRAPTRSDRLRRGGWHNQSAQIMAPRATSGHQRVGTARRRKPSRPDPNNARRNREPKPTA
jgi:hypothetical protein